MHFSSRPMPRRTPDNITIFLADDIHNGFLRWESKVARSAIVMDRIAAAPDMRSRFDVAALLEAASGVPLITFQALLFGGVSNFLDLDIETYRRDWSRFGIHPQWFRSTAVDPSVTERFLSLLTADIDEFAEKARDCAGLLDFTLFRDRPLFSDHGVACPFDIAFLAEKFENAPLWLVLAYLPEDQRQPFLSFWGQLFERYIGWLLEGSCQPPLNRLIRDPRWSARPNDQICDDAVLCGSDLVMLEHKGGMVRTGGKYDFDPAALKQEVDKKYVARGIDQLACSINALISSKDPAQVTNLDVAGVSTIFPVMVVRDDVGATFGVNAYLAERLKERLSSNRSSRSVAPLVVLSVQDLENLTPYLCDTPLSALLSGRIKGDRSLRRTFLTVENKVLLKKGPRQPEMLLSAFHEFVEARLLPTLNLPETQ